METHDTKPYPTIFERQNLQTDSKNLAKHPPKWWGRLLVHAFPFSGEYQANFWKLQILAPLGALLPLWLTQTQKWTAEYRLWVYNSEIWFLGSPNLSAPLVFCPLKRSKVGQKRYGLMYINRCWLDFLLYIEDIIFMTGSFSHIQFVIGQNALNLIQ